MIMRKIQIIISILLVAVFTSCEVLDVEPSQSISADEAIKTKTDLDRALTGCYDALQQTSLTRTQLIIGGLAADNLVWTGTTQDYGQIENNNITADNAVCEGVWVSIYDGLNRINNVLYAMPNVPDLSQGEIDNYNGQLKFLRALLHFYGVRLYGEIPIKTEPSLDTEGLNVSRNTIDQVYEAIMNDLNEAESLLEVGGSSGYASRGAASALLARIYLYRENYEMAKTKATEVINSYGYSIDPSYANLFSGQDSDEIIFHVEFDAQDRNRIAEYFFSRTVNGGRKEISPDTLFIETYDDGDLRLAASIADADDGPYVIKYSDISGGTDNVIVIRLAEMYLIRAEANAMLEAPVSEIRDDLKVIRERAGLGNVSAYSLGDLILAIEAERRTEFAFEGHRWFDLVRTGRAVELIPTVTSVNQTLFPIPQSEILANPNMTQNPGY
jgi:hypothetical protein